MQFRKKPVVVNAVQWTGVNADEVLGFTLGRASVRDESFRRLGSSERVLVIETLEGSMRAEPGDWIICGVKGEFYPCKPDIFSATYEPAQASPCGGLETSGDAQCDPARQETSDPAVPALAGLPSSRQLVTECCGVEIAADCRYCPKCGYEARVDGQSGLTAFLPQPAQGDK